MTAKEDIDSLEQIGRDRKQVQEMVVKYMDKPAEYFPVAMTEYHMRAGAKDNLHISNLIKHRLLRL